MTATKDSKMLINYFLPVLLATSLIAEVLPRAHAGPGDQGYVRVKDRTFSDPYSGYGYLVSSFNLTQMAAESTHRSMIRVTRFKLSSPNTDRENIQTLQFNPSLVDFDISCLPSHCYLVCVTSRSKRNVELFKWMRTQFDLEAKRDSFARPHGVRIFSIGPNDFYIAIAQEQLHLSPYKYSTLASGGDDDDDEPTRFIGCAVLKFTRGHERTIKYHQFIRLPFNPLHVHYYKSISANDASNNLAVVQPTTNHYLIFSLEANWADQGASQVYSFIWTPINDYFWPYRMPRGAEYSKLPSDHFIKLPEQSLPGQDLMLNFTQPQDYLAPVEACFYQLQRLLADRDLQARRLIAASESIWRARRPSGGSVYESNQSYQALTNISAQVVVLGNVTVIGSLIESPQISLIGGGGLMPQMPLSIAQVSQLARIHSPAIVENRFKQAQFRLNSIRTKLSHAILANLQPQSLSYFNTRTRFHGGIKAREVILHGVSNSNVRLNGIYFKQLENELVSLSGQQEIGAAVVFDGHVVADVLEIHGKINDYYYLRDAIDITSRRVQIIDTTGQNYITQAPNMATLDFASIGTPEVILAHNASLNTIQLQDFITRDNRTQLIFGRKSFKRLSMAKLDLAHQGVALNGFNLSQLARQAILLRPDPSLPPNTRLFQTLNQEATFVRPVKVNRLTLNNIINQHINLTSLIHDSIKTNDLSLQQIFGQKNFLAGLRINRLTTEGAVNGILASQIFNLNAAPPTSDHYRYQNSTPYGPQFDVPIEGRFRFGLSNSVLGRVSATLVNGVDLARSAIRRSPLQGTPSPPQIVHGHKIFTKPLRVVDKARLIDLQEINNLMGNNTPRSFPYPMVNNIDLRLVSAGLQRQKRQPSLINVGTLEIDGNLNIPDNNLNRTTLGSYLNCPLDAIRTRAVLAGVEDQSVDAPIRVNSLRAKSIVLDSGPLNDFYFPNDFVLRTSPSNEAQILVEPIYGVKTIEHLHVAPSIVPRGQNFMGGRGSGGGGPATAANGRQGIVVDWGASINQVPYSELQTFVQHENQPNATGEKVYNTMNVYGNLYSKRINGNHWPDDILLKSLSSLRGIPRTPYGHKRIYSNLIFTESSSLEVVNQLVLRGPIQLDGRMNGVNLTEFSRQSATYYDKDLFSAGRPIRNKIFLGGMSVKGEIRSQGLIDGVNFDEMRRRVVTIGPSREARPVITGAKMFMSDVVFQNPISMVYLNDLAIDNYLKRIQFQPDGVTLKIFGKKTITGALRINRNLYVNGTINGVDFPELQARAIPLSPESGELRFNKTLTVEGDVFMDNLWIDERNGTIDGVRLTDLLPIGTRGKNELILTDYRVSRKSNPYGRVLVVDGSVNDCPIKCDLEPRDRPMGSPAVYSHANNQTHYYPPAAPAVYVPLPSRPYIWPAQPVYTRTTQPLINNQSRNFTLTRTTPPYSLSGSYQPPIMIQVASQQQPPPPPLSVNRPSEQQIIRLNQRQPMSIRYEQRAPLTKRHHPAPDHSLVVMEQLEILRRHIVSINLIRLSSTSNLVVGFIEAPTNDLSSFILPELDVAHFEHETQHRPNYLQLDQIDFPFKPTIYHLSVGVATNQRGINITSVSSSFGGRNLVELSVLPVTHPNSAKFLVIPDVQALFLLISQDYSLSAEMCTTSNVMLSNNRQQLEMRQQQYPEFSRSENGVHVYLFHALQNSSSLTSAYFDLYQTIDLPGIDSFESFSHNGSSYILAVSRALGRIYLLLLRGYTGFQVVSHIDAPMVERVSVMHSHDQKPVLVIHQTSGLHRVMEAVII